MKGVSDDPGNLIMNYSHLTLFSLLINVWNGDYLVSSGMYLVTEPIAFGIHIVDRLDVIPTCCKKINTVNPEPDTSLPRKSQNYSENICLLTSQTKLNETGCKLLLFEST